jgi:hypothetical protein
VWCECEQLVKESLSDGEGETGYPKVNTFGVALFPVSAPSQDDLGREQTGMSPCPSSKRP